MHRLTDIDPDARTATCAICGPTAIHSNGPRWRCAIATRDYQRAHPRSPRRTKAYKAVYLALQNGRLTKPASCPQCGAGGALEAHHDNYDEPLNVTWLCKACHEARHHNGPSGLSIEQPYGA